jgi:hypothetical protein
MPVLIGGFVDTPQKQLLRQMKPVLGGVFSPFQAVEAGREKSNGFRETAAIVEVGSYKGLLDLDQAPRESLGAQEDSAAVLHDLSFALTAEGKPGQCEVAMAPRDFVKCKPPIGCENRNPDAGNEFVRLQSGVVDTLEKIGRSHGT